MKKKVISNLIVLAILLGSAAIAYLYIVNKPEVKKSPKAQTILSMKVAKEKVGEFPIEVDYPARVSSQDIVSLGVEVSGKIDKGEVYLKEGATFRKGDLLFSVNQDDINTQLKSDKSKFLTLMSQVLPDIKLDYSSEYEKWNSFFNSIEIDKPLPELPVFSNNKERVFIAAKEIVPSYYDIETKEILKSKHKIYAPFNGVFTTVSKEVGTIVNSGTVVGIISSTDNLDIVAGVSIEDAARFTLGDNAKVIARDGEEFVGKIKRISSYVNKSTQMVDVYINLHEPTKKIIEGEMIDVIIPAGRLKDVIKLPVEAVGNNGRIYGVNDESKLYYIDAKVEYEIGEWAYLSGVKDGLNIIQESVITAYEGLPVNILDEHID